MASSKIKGITIEINGNTSKLNDALRSTEQQLNKTQKELRDVNNSLRFDPKNTEILSQKQKLLADAIKDTTSKLKTLKEAQEQARAKGLDQDNEDYRALEREISRTTQSLKGLQTQQDSVNNALNEGKDRANIFGDVLKANITSQAIIGGITALVGALKKVSETFVNLIKDGANYADEINTLSKQFNLSTKEIQQYQRASQLIDVEFNTIAKSLTKLTKQMTATSKETVNAFKQLGISVKDSNGELRDSNDVFNETIEALSKIENETLQDSLALQIFGKSSAELGSLINGGAEQLKEFNEYLEQNNLLLSQDELDALNEVQDGFDVLGATVDAMKMKIASELAPVITPLLDQLQEYIIDHKEDIEELVKNVVDYLTSEEFKETFNKIVDDVKDFVDDKIPKIKEDLPIIFKGIKDIASVLGGIAKTILFIVNGIEWAFEHRANDLNKMYNDLFGEDYFKSGGYGALNSRGFGALRSGGYNNITLNASFTSNGSMNETDAIRFADIITARINENLGNQL